MEKLKPCDCGNENVKIVFCDVDCCGAKPRWVECGSDKCDKCFYVTVDTKAEAITAWNTRGGKDE